MKWLSDASRRAEKSRHPFLAGIFLGSICLLFGVATGLGVVSFIESIFNVDGSFSAHAQTPADPDVSMFVDWTSLPVPAYATLYELDDTCSITTINTGTPGTYSPWTTATVFYASGNMATDISDATGDSITVPANGPYQIDVSVSFKGSLTAEYSVAVTVNGILSEQRTLISGELANTIGAVASPMVHVLLAGDKVRMAFDADVTANVDICNVNLTAVSIGGVPQ